MKKIFLLMLIAVLVLSSCTAKESSVENKDVSSAEVEDVNNTEPEELPMLKEFDKESLAKYNGEKNMPKYIAVDGVVYDVSDEEEWKSDHQGTFAPGKDYSVEIKESPHGVGKLKKLPVVGTYKE